MNIEKKRRESLIFLKHEVSQHVRDHYYQDLAIGNHLTSLSESSYHRIRDEFEAPVVFFASHYRTAFWNLMEDIS